MFGVSFDMNVSEMKQQLGSERRGYQVIRQTLTANGFRWVQGSFYVCDTDDLTVIYKAIHALDALGWFGPAVGNVRIFRIDQWSDFTEFFKALTPST